MQTEKEKRAVQVPDRPQMAPNVELSGEMQDSGFENSQYLVQRNGHFLQVTNILYGILEEADGRHTVDEIAGDLSSKTGSELSGSQVRRLIGEKLIPAGLVVGADGSVAGAGEEGKVRSPLKINLKTKVLGPDVIGPVTRLLEFFYLPPVVAVVLLASVAGQFWVFVVHGIAPGIHQMLYQPALMLLVLAIIIILTAFHELGHATATRYGGGEVRGMGVGFYLVYPAFYTDTTDVYKLGRGARIRTDLGGFYFNLIFASAMVGLYFLTHQEFLLVTVLITDLDIVEQLLPFVRLDGYWALADLTGIPDFYSFVLPFLRTQLHLPFWKGRQLPGMKGWVKVAFWGYILIAIPGMILVMFLLIKNVPRVIVTAGDSAGKQAQLFVHASGHGDVLGMVVAGIQILVLALPAFGGLYIVFNLGRTIFKATWQWGRSSTLRRAEGIMADVVVVAVVAYLWIPQLPFLNHGPLRSTSTFRPIAAGESGTVGGAVADVFRPGGSPPAARTRAVVSPTPGSRPAGVAVTPTAHPTAAATPGATIVAATPTPAAVPTVGATVTPPPAATATPTPLPAAPTRTPQPALATPTPAP